MNTNFPLFDILYKEAKTKIPKAEDKIQCVDNISTLDNEGKRLIYVIIKTYREHVEKILDNNVPYEGQKIAKENSDKVDLVFNFNDFPHKLKNMIIIFVNKHIEKMNMEKDRFNGV